MRHRQPKLVLALVKYERSGMQLSSALRTVMLDGGAGWYWRGFAARELAVADAAGTAAALLDLFYTQTNKIELWETALTIEHYNDGAVVPRLIEALSDANLHRRHGAARALGWIEPVSRRAAKALVRALSDPSQPQAVREEAAESLAYSNYGQAIPTLVSVLDEPDVRIRFWSVFALGSIGRRHGWGSRREARCADPRVVEALKRMLSDGEVPPGNWWSVGREALAMLGMMEPQYKDILASETERVLRDRNASPEDLRWADGYGG